MAPRDHEGGRLRLRLYLVKDSPNSVAARRNLAERLRTMDDVELEVVDVLDEPERAMADGVLVTPMLVRLSPEPRRRAVGDLSRAGALDTLLEVGEG